MGNRYFDLGNLSVNNGLNEAGDEWLLECYWGEPCTRRRLATVRLMRIMSDFREAMWGVVQTAISEIDFDFAGLRRGALRARAGRASRTRASRSGSRTRVARELPGARPLRDRRRGRGGLFDRLPPRAAWAGSDVVLVDRKELTSGSTFHSAGLVGQLRGSVSLTRMMMDSVELYRTLDCGWVECGGLRLASSEERWEETRRQAGWAKTFGLPLELLSAEEALERFPLMTIDGVLGASWLPTDGYLDPSLLTYALAEGAREAGCDIHTNTRVTGDRRRGRPRARRRRPTAATSRPRWSSTRAACSRPRSGGWRACACRSSRWPTSTSSRSRSAERGGRRTCRRCATPTS